MAAFATSPSVRRSEAARVRTQAEPLENGRRRVLVEGVAPAIDGGRHPVKRVAGDRVEVSCDLVSDGHDAIAGRVLYRRAGAAAWQAAPLAPIAPLGTDRWGASFVVADIGRWEYTFEAWVDAFTTWRRGTERKLAAKQDVSVELEIGAGLIEAACARKPAPELEAAARSLRDERKSLAARFEAASAPDNVQAMAAAPDLSNATRFETNLEVVVDPPLARFSAWYELFPRSVGTFKDLIGRLEYVAELGFDVLYLPPIHPIGKSFRKGPNNTLVAGPRDPGSPWAIGAKEGGHTAVHPELGTLEDFRNLVAEADKRGIAIALDVAFQVSPDHPWVKEHPSWFVHRPDGTIQYAENPPKKYQDVYPFDFESDDWRGLWNALLGVFTFWIDQGVHVFRVDNPHTKGLRFWEWCIGEIKRESPEVLFLAEAFTRPKLMYALAKAGFSQSYTYFTWRETKQDLETYMKELTAAPVSDFFRPNFWPNTPDILPEHLQHGGKPMFVLRLALAATLSSSYGIYGPTFELMEHVARPGSEDYLGSEKFEKRTWNLDDPRSIRDVIARVNQVRREHPALQGMSGLTFHRTDSDALIAFSKREGDDVVLVVANLDTVHPRTGFLELDLAALGVGPDDAFQVHDLLSDLRFSWRGSRNYVAIDPSVLPVHLFAIRRRVRTEHDFEYYL